MGKLDEFANVGKALSGLTSGWNTGLGYYNNNEAAVGKNQNQDLINQRLQALLNADQDYDVFNTGAQAQAEQNRNNYGKANIANQLQALYTDPTFIGLQQQAENEGLTANTPEFYDWMGTQASKNGNIALRDQFANYAKQKRDEENRISNAKQAAIMQLKRMNLGDDKQPLDIQDIGQDKDGNWMAYIGKPIDPSDPEYDPNSDTHPEGIYLTDLNGGREALRTLQYQDINTSEPAILKDMSTLAGVMQRDQKNATTKEIADNKNATALEVARLREVLKNESPQAKAKLALQQADELRKTVNNLATIRKGIEQSVNGNVYIPPEQKQAEIAKQFAPYEKMLQEPQNILRALNIDPATVINSPAGTLPSPSLGNGASSAMGSSLANIDFQGNNQNSAPGDGAPQQLLQPSQDINPFLPDQNADAQMIKALQQIMSAYNLGGQIPFTGQPYENNPQAKFKMQQRTPYDPLAWLRNRPRGSSLGR